jgi:outer membrane biosynthesis protein TonB
MLKPFAFALTLIAAALVAAPATVTAQQPPPSPIPTGSASPTPLPSETPPPSPLPSEAPSATPMPSTTPSVTPSPTPTPSPIPSVTPSPTPLPTPTPTPSTTPLPTATPLPTPLSLPPDAPPQILAVQVSDPVFHGGELITGTIITSTNVAAVEIRLAGHKMRIPRTDFGIFQMSYTMPRVPFWMRKTYTAQVVAMNSAGVEAERDVTISVR